MKLKHIHFITTADHNSIGGGTVVWKTLIPELISKFIIHIHYSDDAEIVWQNFLSNKIIHHSHKKWKTSSNNKSIYRYDSSYKDFNFKLIENNSLVVLDSFEAVRQLTWTLSSKRCKIYWHMQSRTMLPRFNFIIRYLDQFVLSKLTKIISISNYLKDISANFNKKICVVYNGVPQASATKLIETGKEEIAFFGRYEYSKNPLFLEKLDCKVIYIGSATSATRKIYVPKEKDLGWRTPLNAANEADIFVFPCIGEGFGLALVELMSYGKICICFNSGAFPEIIENDISGFLVEPFDKEKVKQIIQEIKNNPTKKRNIQFGAMERAKKFTVEKYTKNFYTSIIS